MQREGGREEPWTDWEVTHQKLSVKPEVAWSDKIKVLELSDNGAQEESKV